MRGLKVGDKIVANWDENLSDHVRSGIEYEVVRVNDLGNFFIINDLGKESMPISTSFRKVVEAHG